MAQTKAPTQNTNKPSKSSQSPTIGPTGNPMTPILIFLKPYTSLTIGLIFLVIVSNGLSLFIPRYIGMAIDNFQRSQTYSISQDLSLLGLITVGILIFTFAQIAATSYVSEKVARDLRSKLSTKIASQSYGYVNRTGASDLLTNLTGDVDAVKTIISQGIVSAFAAVILLLGSITLLLGINFRLGLIAISILPVIAVAFFYVFRRISKYFREAQENLSRINQVINESVVGAMLIRVLNSQQTEMGKFEIVSDRQRQIGYNIIDNFSALIPIVNLISNAAIVIILWFGGQAVIAQELSLGQFSAFISYFNLLITPIFLLGLISNVISRSVISLERINSVLNAPLEGESVANNPAGSPFHPDDHGSDTKTKQPISKAIKGAIEFREVDLNFGDRHILKKVSFRIQPGTKNAILGPTAAGKSQIFSLLTALELPSSGQILVDGVPILEYDKQSLFSQLGLVFQDSVIFNTTLRENIQFSDTISDEAMRTAIDTANLHDLIDSLPQGLDTLVSERGSNLSGGQKQRLMLARALALNPKILLLDDFTARVDINTERQILASLQKNYPDVTLVSITQKIEPIKAYDQILVLMQGELIAAGQHPDLLRQSLEYQQIWESQQTTEAE